VRIIGIDLEIGSSPQSSEEALYSAYAMIGSIKRVKTQLTRSDLVSLIQEFKPNYLALDNIYELGSRAEILSISNKFPKFTKIVEVTHTDNRNTSLIDLAKRAKIPVFSKPNSKRTAEICALLCQLGIGATLNDINSNSWKWIKLEPKSISKLEINFDLKDKEITPKVLNSFLQGFSKISSISTVIGRGKEAIVCLAEVDYIHPTIIKVYQAYSPVAKKYRISNPHKEGWRTSIALAKREALHLEYLESKKVPAPRLYFIEGPVLGMEPILNQDRIATVLAKTNLKSIGDPSDYLVEVLDILLHLFGKK